MALLTSTTLAFTGRTDARGGVTAFAFTAAEPSSHHAGHHAFLTLRSGGTKPFSLASAPGDPEVLIGTRLDSGSRFKRALAGLSPGDRVRLRRPLQRSPLAGAADAVVLIAQGAGVTPHRALPRPPARAGAPPRRRRLRAPRVRAARRGGARGRRGGGGVARTGEAGKGRGGTRLGGMK